MSCCNGRTSSSALQRSGRTHKDVVGVWDLARLAEHVQQVVELAMDVAADLLVRATEPELERVREGV